MSNCSSQPVRKLQIYIVKLVYADCPQVSPDVCVCDCLVEELVLPTPFVDFVVTPLAWLEKHGFFPLKLGKVEHRGVYFGPLIEGFGAHRHNFFRKWEILVTR